MPLVTQVPTFIVGMDVSHGSPGQSDIPSIAAVTLFLVSYDVIHIYREFKSKVLSMLVCFETIGCGIQRMATHLKI